MRLKTFTAQDMTEAMALVRRELGPDALIVATTRTRAGNLEVRAAVDASPPAPRRPAESAPADPEAAGRTLAAALAFHGAPPAIAQEIVQAAGRFGAAEPVTALAKALEERFAFWPLSPAPARPILILGPPGAGKSSAVGKLAARARHAGAEVDLVAADPARAGAGAQVRAYANAIGAGVLEAKSTEDVADLLANRDEARVCLIDAAPTRPFDLDDLDACARLVRLSGADPLLVLDVGAQPMDLADAAALFKEIGVRRVVLAKCDAARRRGGLLGIGEAGLAFAAVSASPFIGGGVGPATPLRLARLLLDDSDFGANPS